MSYMSHFDTFLVMIYSYLQQSTVGVFSSTTTRFQARGEAECLISRSAVKYLPYDICIRLFS
jgi:hypothetical protein